MSSLREEMKLLCSNTKGRLFLRAFRRSHYFACIKGWGLLGRMYRVYYTVVFRFVLGIDIPDVTSIAYGFNLYHGQGVVINASVLIGRHCIIRQNTTIGNATPGGGSPVIGDNVQVGANVVIIGPVTIGDGAVIAAGSVVIGDVPSGALVAGNPAVFKRFLRDNDA